MPLDYIRQPNIRVIKVFSYFSNFYPIKNAIINPEICIISYELSGIESIYNDIKSKRPRKTILEKNGIAYGKQNSAILLEKQAEQVTKPK